MAEGTAQEHNDTNAAHTSFRRKYTDTDTTLGLLLYVKKPRLLKKYIVGGMHQIVFRMMAKRNAK